ncbi:hypothetical protein EMCRGX_G007807 [Ephydatia muelleri]
MSTLYGSCYYSVWRQLFIYYMQCFSEQDLQVILLGTLTIITIDSVAINTTLFEASLSPGGVLTPVIVSAKLGYVTSYQMLFVISDLTLPYLLYDRPMHVKRPAKSDIMVSAVFLTLS